MEKQRLTAQSPKNPQALSGLRCSQGGCDPYTTQHEDHWGRRGIGHGSAERSLESDAELLAFGDRTRQLVGEATSDLGRRHPVEALKKIKSPKKIPYLDEKGHVGIIFVHWDQGEGMSYRRETGDPKPDPLSRFEAEVGDWEIPEAQRFCTTKVINLWTEAAGFYILR